MNINIATIKSQINSDFTKVYRAQSNFPNSGYLWNECINTISNPTLMNNIIFCNDIMKIPPVKTFLISNENIIMELSNEEKKAIGAFWGFVFKYVLGYKNQKESVPVNTKGVKKASRFYDNEIEVKVV